MLISFIFWQTSESTNAGNKKEELDGLWLMIMDHLSGMMSSVIYPPINILHHIGIVSNMM